MKSTCLSKLAVGLAMIGMAGLAEANPVISDGLVAAYEFNGNANDSSGNGYNGIVNGAALTTDRFGNANSAYSFNGSSSKISSPVDANLSVSQVTLSAWINASGQGGYATPTIVQINPGSDNPYGISPQSPYYGLNFALWHEYPHTAQLYTTVAPHGADAVRATAPIYNDNWYQIAATFDGSYVNIYLDGVLNNTQLYPHPLFTFNSGILAIGYSEGNYDWFNGTIDDVDIYNRALTATEIGTLYTAPNPVPEPESYAMLLAGLGLLRFVARRRKQQAA